MNRRGNATAAANKLLRGEKADGHDPGAAEQAAEFDHLVNFTQRHD